MARQVVGTGAAGAAPVVGVVGGGQLARMLQEAAIPLGIELDVLVESRGGSADQAVVTTTVADADDTEAVLALASRVDAMTVEHEHVAEALLDRAAQLAPVRPAASALAYAQDKLVMRQKMAEIDVPCPRWRRADSPEAVADAVRELGGEAIVKTPRDGYDGKGVMVARATDGGIDGGERVAEWLANGPLLVEEKVPFVRELAQLVARRPGGDVASWCAVETIQDRGVCFETIAPAPVEASIREEARRIGETIAGALGVVGVLAVELFEVDGRLLVNELAMRPHNSGHWTIEGARTSQFEQHLRAVLDLPLGDTAEREQWAVMVNVLGSELQDPREAYPAVMGRYPEAKIHMYGKAVTPRRKLGHVTVCGPDLAAARAAAQGAAALLRGEA